ncbi:Geranylgeranyl pyrophosphate synthase [Paramyrothecium foliicola]|nr:Geranylgeranyl pyrophosphate synthase [Paramyrothecium foliicola]
MLSNPLQTPNAIPPRTSSSGIHRGHSHSHSYSHPTSPPPPRSIINPVSEANWIGQKQLLSSGSPTAAAAAMGSQQPVVASAQGPPPPDPSRYAYEDLNFAAKKTWTDEKEKVVRGPYDYVTSHPGKDFRAQLIASFNAWLEVPSESLDIITRVVGMLHESSLLVDDVQDSSELRRGFPVAHNIFGVAQTINSANYIYFAALAELQRLGNHEAVSMFAQELVNLHRGQGMDLFWRDTLTCPTEEDYLEMVGNKTGGLFRLGIKLMKAESKSEIDCVPLVNLIGLIFQIRDDYMNLSSSEYSSNKGMCEDLTEGKFSFPVIHSIRSDPTNLQLINILKMKTTDVEVKRYAVKYMERTGSFEYTRAVLAVLIQRARKMADDVDKGLGRTIGIQKILDKMVVE